jgi:rod shape-determining protein MreD
MLASAIIGGILIDSLNGIPVGFSALCFCVIGSIVRQERNLVFIGETITHIAIGGLAATGYIIGMYCLLSATLKDFYIPFSMFMLKAFSTGLIVMLIFPLVFLIMYRTDEITGNIQGKQT